MSERLGFIGTGSITPVLPPEPAVMALFDALGRALPVPDAATFQVYSAAGAVMATYFGLVGTAVDWATTQGLSAAAARAFMASLFGNLGDVLRQDARPLDDLRIAYSTAGGLNEQVHAAFLAGGGPQALTEGLTAALHRIRGT